MKMNRKAIFALFGLLVGLGMGSSAFAAPPTNPTVTSPTFADVTSSTATLGGNVTDGGNKAVTSRGVEWGTSSGTYPNSVTAGTAGLGVFTVPVTGLPSNTTIYFRAWATNQSSLTGYSAEASFTTDPVALTAPTVTVQAATAIGTRSATLNGTITVNGSAADNDTYFEYGTSSGPPYDVTTGTVSTIATGSFALPVTGLEPNTLYYYRACATANEAGGLTGCSTETTFTTDPLVAPTVSVQAATLVVSDGATLHGTITTNGSAADNNTYFKYGTSSGVYTVTTGSAGTVTNGAFQLAVTGLDPSTTYYYIACATANETGGLEGCSPGEESFTTTVDLTAPTVTVQPASNIGTNGATLNGNVTINGSAADNDTYFKYGTSSGVYTVTTGTAGTVTTGAFSLAVTGLDPNTTYFYIACATANEVGGLEGCSASEQSFTTLHLAPTVTVQPATSIGSRTATLNGTVTVNGSAADNDTYFKYGTSSGVYGTTTGTAGTVTTGAFNLAVTGLEPDTTYFYIACATANEAGGLEGCSASEETFTTDPLTAPTVTVQAATSVGSRTATLNGTITANGSAPDNNTYFEYGTSSGPAYDTTSGTVSTIATGAFALPVTGLEPNTLYYYRACATANETGGLTGCSTETTFTTDPLTAPTVTTQAATSIGSRTATLNGTVTVNGSAPDNDTYFEYGLTSGEPYDITSGTVSTIATGSFALPVSGLEPDTLYYYRACATANETGGLTGCSTETSFTTTALAAPTVTVQAATGIGTNGATMNGTVTVNGSATDNDTYFKYGTTSGGPYGTTTTSAGTVVTGPFAKTVSGLDTSTTYYYIACATANETGGLEGCSAGEQSFTTVSSVSQASNLWFHNIGSTGMTLFWTEGIGDGSIVLMKAGSAVDANPVDGTEHVADSVFGSGAQIGTGNFVVYRGTGEAVHVTGLTQGVTYHVAVFTYTGAGAAIEYLLPSPAIGSQTTSDYTPHNAAILNIDDTVTCTTGCHGFHGSFGVPRGTDQETLCMTCHNPTTGMLGAEDLLDFSLHTNSKSSPPSSPGVVDCGSCHEVHNPGSTNTTISTYPGGGATLPNLHYIRANADKYVSTALAADMVLHTDAASEDWAIPGTSYQGVCQNCHTLTVSGYTNDGTGQETSHQGGADNCRGCHTHGSPTEGGGFSGAGGDCTGCHGSIQDLDGEGIGNPGRRAIMDEITGTSSTHLPGTVDAADCEVCHDQSSHQGGQVKLFDPDGGTSILIASYTDPNTNSTEADKLTVFCLNCHDANGANGDTTPFTTGATVVNIEDNTTDPVHDWTNASHNTTGSVSCFGDGEFGCHGSAHGSNKLTMLAPWDVAPDPTTLTEEQEGFCFNCHDADGPAGTNIEQGFIGTPDYTAVGVLGAAINSRHDVLHADQQAYASSIECNSCHLPHKDGGANYIVSDPDNPTADLQEYLTSNSYTDNGYSWSYRDAAGDLDPTHPEGGTGSSQRDYIQFCLTCHDGQVPAGITMKANMLNIAGTYDGEQHGAAAGSSGSKINKGNLKPPWNTLANYNAGNDPTSNYAALQCNTCHGPHGSANIFNLRTSITVDGVQMTLGGNAADGVTSQFEATHQGQTTYTLPEVAGTGTQAQLYWGAWCTFCHNLSAHPGVDEATACQGSHQHGGGNF